MTLPNLAVLQKKCEALGLKVTQKGKRPAKDDYVQVLREHHMPAGGLKYVELDPMLCFAEWNLKPEEQAEVWRDGNSWVAQRKLNGCRVILHFVKGVGVFAHSRTVSVKTYRMQELTQQFTWHEFVPNFTATIDAEAIIEKPIDSRPYTSKGEVTKTSLHSTVVALHLEPTAARRMQVDQDAQLMIQAFDITNWQGKDLRPCRLETRIGFLASFRSLLIGSGIEGLFQFPEIVATGKRTFFEKVVAEGGEGVILKNLESRYEDSSSRSRTGWVKVKKRQEYDAFVSGFLRGEPTTGWKNLVGALEFSVNTDQGPHVIGYASNLTMENRERLTVYDQGNDVVALHPSAYGKVAEISGQDISARELRLSHCTIDRWRPKQGPDAKTADQCFVKMADLRAASEWVG